MTGGCAELMQPRTELLDLGEEVWGSVALCWGCQQAAHHGSFLQLCREVGESAWQVQPGLADTGMLLKAFFLCGGDVSASEAE